MEAHTQPGPRNASREGGHVGCEKTPREPNSGVDLIARRGNNNGVAVSRDFGR